MLPVPLSRMVAPYATTKGSQRNIGTGDPHTGYECDRGAELEAPARRPGPGTIPSDEAATKLLYLILNRSEKEWKMPQREWTMAKAQFAVIFGERFIRAIAA